MLGAILAWITSGPLDRIFKTIDTSINNETKREDIKTRAAESYMAAQVSVATGKGWWAPLLFYVPAGFWFGSVCVYSVLWCRGCVFPQPWSVAALPPSLDPWIGPIIGTLFIGKAGGDLISRLRK